MNTEQRDVESVFHAAVQRPTPAERAAYLDGACEGNDDLRARIEDLLKAHEEAGLFLEPLTFGTGDTTVSSPPIEGPGSRIGRYKLLQRIGEGGFGVVYMAEQEEPVRRKVALKIIKLGMDTKQVIARFEAERQALAMMEHPNIAKVLDAGATETGRPYFVMELVKGVPITEYCDRNSLSTPERLELFVAVCSAVQHAHQKGIIHRDIKPKNVLVTLHDGRPVPKVIDFGIAKATSHRLTEKTLFTEFRQFVGTPAYMSPEQAEMSGLDVDTRADIYSLGVLLYELLTGTTPFDEATLREAGYDEIQRIIREVEPPKPSTRVSTLQDALIDVARHRRVEPGALGKLIRGDLDWIVMKAMDKNRTRRYETANEMAGDIERHLRNEPVLAGPPSVPYKLHKFVRRHRVGVAASIAAAAALVFGFSAATVGYAQATKAKAQLQAERDNAQLAREEAEGSERTAQQQRDLAEAHAEAARREAAKSAAIADFLQKMLAALDPAEALGREVTVRYMLDAAARRIDEGALAEQPEVEAAIRTTIGKTYVSLGLYDAAQAQLETAASMRTKLLGPEDPDTLQTRSSLAGLLNRRGQYAEAEKRLYEIVEAQRRVLGEEHPDTLISMNHLGVSLWRQQKFSEAEPIHRRALEIQRRVLGEENVDTIRSATNLGTVLQGQCKFAEAEEQLRHAWETARRTLGEEHPDTMPALNNLALTLECQGKLAEAEVIYRQVLEHDVRVQGPEHPNTQIPLYNLKRVLRAQGKHEELRRLLAEEIALQKLVASSPDASALTLNHCAWMWLTCEIAELRDAEAALPVAQRAVALDGGKDPNILDTLALAYEMTGDLDRAIDTQQKAVTLARSTGHYGTLGLEDRLVDLLAKRRKHFAAFMTYCQGLPGRIACLRYAKPGGDDMLPAKIQKLIEAGHYAKVEPYLIECYMETMAKPDLPDPKRRQLLKHLVEFYEAWGRPDRAEQWRNVLRGATEHGEWSRSQTPSTTSYLWW